MRACIASENLVGVFLYVHVVALCFVCVLSEASRLSFSVLTSMVHRHVHYQKSAS